MGKKILEILLGICMAMGSIYMSYTLGRLVVRDYYMFGISGVIIGFIFGAIAVGIFSFIINKIVGKLYLKSIERK